MINRDKIEFLIVDDEPLVARLLVAYLDDQGHSCAALTDGRQTETWLERHDCEVIVVDLNMPAIDGISLISRIRAIRPRLPIVVFTGVGYDEQKMHAALRAGANGYVSKSLPIEQLYCVLSRVLTTCRQQARLDSPPPARSTFAALV
jgi:DNA-binding response OmpR family regulator